MSQGNLDATGGFSVSSAIGANLFKDYFIEDVVVEVLNFFLSYLGLEVLSSQRMSSVPFLSHAPLCVVFPYPALCSLSLSLTLQLLSATHCASKQSYLSSESPSYKSLPLF